ncbi:hypothetical protein [Pelomonas sp. SE-A7]|uniref:hypothetical protein n=1 Tax=Pelomonas sp. SE-A7 TaxID=3054953 RepID=UPI00259CE89A|nr:hypothetical protein [Pelomonas sp. SE-A7]MDM4767255.1 hypothetical protein [Pelomonas sp. SE-A7]
MKFPAYFDQVPRLRVLDPLAAALGCAEGGVLEYGYDDVVRLTGHSCPTVAASYWLTWRALNELYGDEFPQRGGIRVELRNDARVGSTGVVASVVQMLTGAAGGSGFKGIAGRFARVGLQRYSPDLPLAMRFTRLDNGQAVDAEADLDMLPLAEPLQAVLARWDAGQLTEDDLPRLGRLWHERVSTLLLACAYDPGVFRLRRAAPRRWPRIAS